LRRLLSSKELDIITQPTPENEKRIVNLENIIWATLSERGSLVR
jgi:hypothetical protein